VEEEVERRRARDVKGVIVGPVGTGRTVADQPLIEVTIEIDDGDGKRRVVDEHIWGARDRSRGGRGRLTASVRREGRFPRGRRRVVALRRTAAVPALALRVGRGRLRSLRRRPVVA
jgi:hypothetical protein